jgi:hypothetical protein
MLYTVYETLTVAAEKNARCNESESYADVSAATNGILHAWQDGPRSQAKRVLHRTRTLAKRTGL